MKTSGYIDAAVSRSASGSAALRSSRAFSLLELLTVVVIIMILLALLVPNIRRSQLRAKSAKCQNNLKQYGIALARYVADNEGYFIWPGRAGAGTSAGSKYSPGSSGASIEILRGGDLISFDWTKKYKGFGSRDDRKYDEDTLPDPKAGAHNYDSFLSYIPSVETKHCPAVDYKKVSDPKSPYFKGYGIGYNEWLEYINPASKGLYETTDTSFILNTTYAINSSSKAHQLISNIRPGAIAFIDWNVELGWGGNLYLTTFVIENPKKGIVSGTSKGADGWWKTEVGFNHLDSGGNCANYVAFDGHVASVSSNEIKLSHFQ